MEKSKKNHHEGAIEIFNGKLIALGGWDTRSVEIFDRKWTTKKPIGNKENGKLHAFSSLVLKENKSEVLFVFGKTYFSFNYRQLL
mgnify:CR=1 FL=1